MFKRAFYCQFQHMQKGQNRVFKKIPSIPTLRQSKKKERYEGFIRQKVWLSNSCKHCVNKIIVSLNLIHLFTLLLFICSCKMKAQSMRCTMSINKCYCALKFCRRLMQLVMLIFWENSMDHVMSYFKKYM